MALKKEGSQITIKAPSGNIFKLRLEINLKNLEMIMQWIQIK
jgi:hypothetical protein